MPDAYTLARRNRDDLDRLRTLNLDLSGRRVINAGRSSAPGDYVTREELDEVRNLIQPSEETSTTDTKVLKFNVGTPTITADAVDKRPVLWIPTDRKAIPQYAGARLKTGPSGGSFKCKVHYTPVNTDFTEEASSNIFGSGNELEITDGNTFGRYTSFPIVSVAQLYYFTLEITAVNSASGLYVFVVFLVD